MHSVENSCKIFASNAIRIARFLKVLLYRLRLKNITRSAGEHWERSLAKQLQTLNEKENLRLSDFVWKFNEDYRWLKQRYTKKLREKLKSFSFGG